jgi:hypothetical protein
MFQYGSSPLQRLSIGISFSPDFPHMSPAQTSHRLERAKSATKKFATTVSSEWLPVFLVPVGLDFCAVARQARPRQFWAHSDAAIRLCRPHLNPLGRGQPGLFVRLRLVSSQALKGAARFEHASGITAHSRSKSPPEFWAYFALCESESGGHQLPREPCHNS